MTPIRHDYRTFDSSDGYDVIEQWLKDHGIFYGEYNKRATISAKFALSLPFKTTGQIFIKGFDISDPEDFITVKLRWQ